MRLKTHVIVGLMTLIVAGQILAEPVRDKQVVAELIAAPAAVEPGQTFDIGLRLIADEGWHTYWLNPGSPGYITTLKLDLPEGFTAGPLRFPYPHRFQTKNWLGGADYTGFGYEGEVVLLVEVTAPDNLAPNTEVTLKGKGDWLVCDPSQCVPGGAELSVTLPVVAAGSSVGDGLEAEALRAARQKLPAAPGWEMAGKFEGNEVLLTIKASGDFSLPSGELYVFPLRHDGLTTLSDDTEAIIDPGGSQSISVEDGILTVRAPKSPHAPAVFPDPFSVVMVAESGFKDAAMGKAILLSTDASIASGALSSADAGGVGEADNEAQQKGGEGWGYWLQRPFVVMLLAALMFALALSLFGVFEVGVGLTGAGGKLANASGLSGSFFSGALATVLATPCTAPFMGGAIAFALGQPAWVTMAVFTALGFGMVLPYLLLSIFPGLVQRLPRPGPWMETFKQVMGFPMLAVVVWLLWVLTFQIDSSGMLGIFSALAVLAFAAWWYGRYALPGKSAGVRRLATVVAVLLVVSATVLMSRAASHQRPTETRDVESEIAAIQAEGRGVFVDFTASWCATCQLNKAFMHADEVEQAMADNGIEFLEVDWTRRDPEILKVIQKYGGESVPFYLLYSSDKEEPPVKLPSIFKSNEDIVSVIEDRSTAVADKELTFLPALIAAIIGGLILNVMPCVFPVISLKIMGFVAQAGEDKAMIFRHGLAFSAGAMVFFWLLAGILVALRGSIGG